MNTQGNSKIGIDLGTTNSAISNLEGGQPKIIANAEGGRTTPSVVAFTNDGEILVGDVAKRQSATNPENTISSVKRKMGNNETVITVKKKKYNPQQISAFILQKLKRDAESYLGYSIKDVVITVPAYFNDSQRQATKEAGEIAGLNVLRIINEPTAAALSYGLDKKGKDQTVLVFDLGGGTFDVSLLEIGEGVIDVKATSGDNFLGGDDWDKEIVNHLTNSFKSKNGVDLSKDKLAMPRLKEAAEKAKIELSSKVTTEINIPFISANTSGPLHLQETLSRAQFEKMTSHLLERCKEPFFNVIKDAGIELKDIDTVVLVGGSTRMVAVSELVKKLTNKEPNKSVNPDEVVAMGAAIQAGVIKGDVKDVLLLDVTPLSLGIETKGGIMTKLIERNTTIPAKKSEIFTTAEDNQSSVQIKVYQGERDIAMHNKMLGMFELSGIAPAPRGIPQIEVGFDIDANGIMHISAKDKGTGKEQSMTVTGGSGLTDEEIERMKKEAQEHEEQDKVAREKVTVKNEAESLAYQTEKTLSEHKDKLPEDIYNLIDKDVKELNEALKEDDLDKIKIAKDKLNQNMQKIGEHIYKNAQGATAPQADNINEQKDTDKDNKKTEDEVVDAEVVDDSNEKEKKE